MRIDNNEMQLEGLRLFKEGKHKEASNLQDKFVEMVKESGEDHCPCPTACKYHGKCYECVITHRGFDDHLPYCFRAMINKRIEVFSALSEHSFEPPKGVCLATSEKVKENKSNSKS